MLLTFFINFSCQKEENITNDKLVLEPEIHTKVTKVSQADISNIINLINTNPSLNKANNSLSREADTAIEVDYSEIYQVIDSIGNINHTFRLNVTDNNPHTFYNLVVYQNVQTQSPNPYVLKFEVNEDALESFVLSNYNFDTFDGVVKRYTLDAFNAIMGQSSSSATIRADENVDDCPCEEDVVSPPSGTGGGNADGGGFDPPVIDDIDEDCEYVTYVQGCSGSNGNIYHLQSSCGPDDYVEALSRIIRHCGSESAPLFLNERIEDDCNNPCEDTGGSTVILPPKVDLISTIENCLEVPVSSLGLNGVQTTAVANFINTNGCSEENSAFITLAIEALADNDNDGQPDGEVDFEDKVIVDNSFKNNQKAKCIYDKMKNINGSVFSDLLTKFDNSTNALLVFKVGNIPAASNGSTRYGMTLPRLNLNSTISRYDIVLDQNFVQNATLIEIALALSHEMIHAELMARCVELGVITEMTFDANTYNVGVSFNNNPIETYNTSDLLFSIVADQYTNFSNANSSNPNWQHELFNTFNNRDRIAQNIEAVHPWLDDVSNPINSYVDNALIAMSMDEYFKSISWFGLESTTEHNNLSDIEIAKKNQAKGITNQNYNRNCN